MFTGVETEMGVSIFANDGAIRRGGINLIHCKKTAHCSQKYKTGYIRGF